MRVVFTLDGQLTEITAEIKDLETRIKALTQLVHDLPQSHFDLLKRLAEHFYEYGFPAAGILLILMSFLRRATEYESQNQMSEGALAIVLHPNLLQAPDFGIAMRNMGPASTLVRTLISHVCFSMLWVILACIDL